VLRTGPSTSGIPELSISGGISSENLVLVNGVVAQDNVRRSALPLYIEDSLQETTITTSGVSAEFGRFSGGVINAITKSGGNRFSGTFRDNLANDPVALPSAIFHSTSGWTFFSLLDCPSGCFENDSPQTPLTCLGSCAGAGC